MILNKKHLWLFAILCCHAFSLSAQAADSLRITTRLDSLVEKHLPQGSEAGICVYDLTARKSLYSYRADKLSHPASTMKLLTAITALSMPDADHPFRTEVWYRGKVERDTLRGDLYVVGGFDPEFDNAALDSLSRTVARRAPFHTVNGRILGDVSLKDSLYWGSGWLWDDNPASFQPYLSPLMLAKGVLTVTAIPNEKGDTATLFCMPSSSYYKVTNRTCSRTPAAGRFEVTRNWLEGGNEVTVSGYVNGAQAGSINLAVSERFFMHTFVERLQRDSLWATEAGYAFGILRQDSLAHLLATYETPLQTVLNQMMKESDNLNAESLLCRLGAQATGHRHVSAHDGLKAIYNLIKRLGLKTYSYNLADGCGLSNYNFVSPELLVAFLRYAYSRTDIFRKLYKALPVSGMDGTLRYRMRKGSPAYRRVHAKTGSFTGINCLAGYIETTEGHLLAFAIMNQNVLSARQARAFQDRICEAIVQGQ